ncbi:PKD domain-containing protein [uncultured Methanobacterium sp.]|uniref:PKD domain-containing protein n=1 Tax=uncultured Methanobacterium sp. TaxID=176306 RepID=UPI002AA6C15B|nr:right-handed parallel beta-helix repeat-containing protein [uncultured Methanobacterium sp.]
MLKYRNKSVIFIILALFFCILMTGAVSAATPSANFTADDNWGVDNVTVQFNDTSSGSPTSWSWDFGDNGTSTEQNPTHTYTAVGNYTVSLASSNADGNNTIIKSNYISVLNNVTQFANYRGTNIYVANDNGVKYDVQNGVVASNGAGITYIYVPDSYFVSFRQDGGGLNPIHISSTNSSYNLISTTDQSGTFYITFSGGQPTMPEAILMLAINGTISDDFTVHVTSNGYTWTMNVPAVGNNFATDNLTYSTATVNETFDKSDLIYSSYYKLCSSYPYPIYEGQNMSDTNSTFLIMFIDLYAGALNPSNYASLIDNGAIQVNYTFTGLTANNTAVFNVYGWYSASNHGTGIIMTNSHTGGDSGYTVQGVDLAPVASFTANATSGTAPLDVQFMDTSSNNPTTWFWDFGDGATSTAQNPTHTYTTPGTYTVTLTVTNSAGNNTIITTSYITVLNNTAPNVTATPDAGIYNTTQTVTLTSDQPGSTIYYTTDGSDPTNASNSNRVPYSNPIPINTTTNLNYAAVNTGGVGSSRYNKTYVIDSSIPTVTVNPEGGNFNSTQSVTLTTVDLDTNTTTYFTTDGTDPKNSSTRVVYSTPFEVNTSITLRYVAVDAAGNWSPDYSQTYNITIATPPVASFTSNATTGAAPLTVQFNDTSSNSPTSWLWDFGDNTTSTEQNPTHTYTSAGTYTVTLTATNSAGNNTFTQTNLISVFLNDAYVSTTGNDVTGNGSEGNPYATIQKAMENVVSGGTVHLLAGIYTGTGNYVLTISKNVNFVGADPATTIIDAAGLGSIFTINSGVTVSIVNLTFENGKVNSAIYNNGNLNLSNCTFTNNTASLGGAIFNNYGTITALNGCTFKGNTATGAGGSSSGGAIYNNYGTISALNSCIFTGNTAPSGGAICNYNGNITTLNNCSFINNTASGSSVGGGAIYNRAGNITSVINSTFIGNNATSSSGIGGAIFNYAGNNIITTVSGCNFINNSAVSAGGAISNSATISTITNCSFTNNTSKNGGAIRNSGTVNILSCIFSSNSASTSGGAIYGGTSTTTVHFSSFVNNTSPSGSAIYRTSGTVNATNNWWGSNNNPSSQVYGTVDYSNWLYMTETVVPTTVANGTTAVVMVSFNNIWNGTDVVNIGPASGHIVDGTLVTFTSDLGSFSPVTATTTNGIATITFTATNDIVGAINATTNSQTVSYIINRLATVISVGNVTGVSGESTNLTATLKDGNGTGLSGQNVTVTVNGTSYTATTDSNGLATVTVTAPGTAGTYTLTASFAGDSLYQPSSNNGTSYLTVQLRDAYVSPTGNDTSGTGTSSNPYATIQMGLNNVVSGGTLHLMAGTYKGTGNYALDINRSVIIVGDDQTTTIIDAAGLGNFCMVRPGVILSITNLTIINGKAPNGGVIYNTGTISSISNCTFANNSANSGGGVILNSNGGTIILIDSSTFINNTVGTGIGGVIDNTANISSITNCTFANNSAGNGGVFYNSGNITTVSDCTFANNTAGNGGVIHNRIQGTATFIYCTFVNNKATNGGVIHELASSKTLNVLFSSFVNNTASKGSVIYCAGSIIAEYNWWGSNSNPTSQIYVASGSVDYSNWLYMIETVNPTAIVNGNNATVTASFNNIWNGTSVVSIDPASGHIPDGIVVNFSSLLGSFDHMTAGTVNGVANAVFTAANLGTGFINATTNSQTVSGNVTVVGIVNNRTNATYTSIQAMIDDVNTLAGDTITFYTGTYTENIVLSKSLILIASGVVHLIPLDASQPVLTITSNGSGSVIQGFNISGALNSNGVSLDSASNVTLVNNTISGNYVGVKFWNSADNTITNNTVTGNAWSGICLDTSNGNTITGNTVFGNQEGVFLANSLGNTITSNNASGNTYTGVTVIGGSGNLVQGNLVQGNGVSGILIQRSANNNVTVNTVENNSWSGICLDQTTGTNVSGNTVSGNQEGIFVVGSQGTDVVANSVINSTFTGISILAGSNDTAIIGNQVSGNGVSGILVQRSNLTTIQGNTLQKNSWSGVCLDQATNTSATVNNFENNPEQALAVGGSGNSFDSNYWSDWPYTFARPIDGDNNISDANPQPSPLGMGA